MGCHGERGDENKRRGKRAKRRSWRRFKGPGYGAKDSDSAGGETPCGRTPTGGKTKMASWVLGPNGERDKNQKKGGKEGVNPPSLRNRLKRMGRSPLNKRKIVDSGKNGDQSGIPVF